MPRTQRHDDQEALQPARDLRRLQRVKPVDGHVVVQCAGDEMIWTFIAEADPSTGQVNCAIEPAKSNAMARLIYQNNC